MNTKDREYIQQLNTSLATLSEKITRYGETIAEIAVKVEGIGKLFKQLPVAESIEEGETYVIHPTIHGESAWLKAEEDKLAALGWTKEEESKEELHSMIKNNKFVDDGSAFQDEVDKTPRVSPVERKREQWESHLTERACSRCNKTEKVNKVHATGSIHVCQRCARR